MSVLGFQSVETVGVQSGEAIDGTDVDIANFYNFEDIDDDDDNEDNVSIQEFENEDEIRNAPLVRQQ